jgi:PKD repeat protein
MRLGILLVIGIAAILILCLPASATWLNVSAYGSGLIYDHYASGGQSWDTVHDAASGFAAYNNYDPQVTVIATTTANKYQNFHRGVYIFNTNSLPLTANVTNVILNVYNQQLYGNSWGDGEICVVYPYPENPLFLVVNDFDNFGSKIYDSEPITGVAAHQLLTFSFSDDGIIKKGSFTTIGLRMKKDAQDTEPAWGSGYSEGLILHAYNDAGYIPTLCIEYSDYAPITDFSANTTTAASSPLSVLFSDTSSHSPTSWLWTFGDGGSSSDQNPVHTYNAAGYYSVSLTATNAGGSDTETKTDYIKIGPAPDDISVNILEKYSGAALINQAITVTPVPGGSGETKTSLYGETLHFNVVSGQSYWFNASRAGYLDYNETYTVPASPGIYNVYMERTLTPIANHSYAHFSVVDQTNGGLIPNAEIRLSDGQTKLTNSAGYAWFSVNNSEQINYYVSKPSGYWPAYGAMNLTTDESILVALQRYTGPTATATMPGWTPVTVPTTGTWGGPVVTLSAQLREQNVQEGMDVWYTNLPFISQFLFLLFIIGGLGLMAGGTRRN